jgi:citronellyl-CoA synthetase
MIGLARIREYFRVLTELAHILPARKYQMPEEDEQTSLGSVFEGTVSRYPDNIMLIFEGRQWTYAQFNAEVNRLARVLAGKGISRGDTVAIFMENRAEYILAMLALVKLGASASLINNSLTGGALLHCLSATNAKGCIVGEERSAAFDSIRDELSWTDTEPLLWFSDADSKEPPHWAIDARVEMASMSGENLTVTSTITAGETALYIFTSGTTGLPKAAVILHRKILAAGQAIGGTGFRLKPEDRLYLCLPIYHITGMGPGVCGFISAGGSIVLRRKFSASSFWSEVQEHQANCFIYVGELCRYLLMQPRCPEEKGNPLKKILGNGLRPDVWKEFKDRFGVSRICEIYGSSEGNVSFMNLLNKDRTIGFPSSKIALVKYNHDEAEILRDESGVCIEAPVGEPGLLLGKISSRTRFDGYTDSAATEKKIVRNVIEQGDQWFNTGDLIREIDVGFALGLKHYQFVDRTGDTFRWRAENVSTNEVGEVLNRHPQINMANVYGVEVPGVEGRAGMVAFALEESVPFDMEAFVRIVDGELPAYARPVFLRIQRSMATTGTFKLLKGELREQAYHLDNVGDDEIYVRRPQGESYERLDVGFYKCVADGSAGY